MPSGSVAIDFVARRRSVRSSRGFCLVLACCLLLCLLLGWCSRRLSVFDPDAPRHRLRDAAAMRTRTSEMAAAGSSLGTQLATAKASVMSLRIVSFNIRYATKLPVRGEQPWALRGPMVAAQLHFITTGHDSPFVCLQEALHSQINDIQAQLGPGWAHIGRGRGKGANDGEFSPIFYRSDRWKCMRSETRWLSPTPEKPSRGWDAANPRIVTMGEFCHQSTGARVVVMSTHFDHIGVVARVNSAKLLITFAEEWGVAKDEPRPVAVLIGGDFNSPPQDGAYQVMTAPGSGMSDLADLVPEGRHYGNNLTYTTFGEPDESPSRIDFLFIQEPRTATVESFGVLANSFDNQIRLSDHRAVVADLHVRL